MSNKILWIILPGMLCPGEEFLSSFTIFIISFAVMGFLISFTIFIISFSVMGFKCHIVNISLPKEVFEISIYIKN